VFISHRFATVHQILVLLHGRDAENGTDNDLALGGVYAEPYTMQAQQFG
jgi:ABC-type transport system involved in Fe-S cluster assembly fused permease/ATPase subunit